MIIDWIKEKFTKKKEPLITVFSTIKGLEEIYPPSSAIESIPEWFKKMPIEVTEKFSGHPGTAKRCPSFVDYFSSGIVLKLWCDIHLTVNKDNTWEVRTPEKIFSFVNHLDNQFVDHLPYRKYSMVLKGNAPWRMMTPKGWNLLQLPLFYNFDKRFEVLPGIIYSDIHYEVNPQMAFHDYGEFLIPRGTPLAMYIPIKREKVTLQVREFDKELQEKEEIAYRWFSGKFSGGYKEHQKFVKKAER
jgi:hypothetical protein